MAKKAYIGAEDPRSRLGDVAVGTVVKINEDGSPVDYIVVHQGLPSTMYDASCNGTWVLRSTYWKKCYIKFGSTNDYANSTMHSNLNNTSNKNLPLSTYDEKFRNAIKTVKIPYRVGSGNGTTIASGANGLSTKLFLLSAKEVGASSGYTYIPDDGACLSYFSPPSYENSKRAFDDGGWVQWVLRSPKVNQSDTNHMISVEYNGRGELGSHYFDGNVNTRHAMILPLDLAIDNDGFISGDFTGGSVARKIKKGYVGVDSKARKIKKAYIGIGGVARPCWSGGELAYYGTITPLSQSRYAGDCATVGNYALFGGGIRVFNSTWSNAMDAYDTSLVRSLPTAHEHREYYSAASVGDYAVFAGGKQSTTYYNAACAYNKSLTRSTAPNLSSTRYNMGSTSFDKYALFAGGQAKSSQRYATIDAYSASLTRTSPATLSGTRTQVIATTVGGYVIFAGGGTSSTISGFVDTVDVFDASFTRTNVVALSERKTDAGATSVGKYALIGGGYAYNASKGDYYTSVVDVYDSSLTKSTASNLSSNAGDVGATSVGGYALFAGGFLYDDYDYFDGLFYDAVDAYDVSLTKTVQNKLSVPRGETMAVTIGDFAIFAGGRILTTSASSASTDAVDVFTVA